jgi:hypothetical protein
MFRVRTRTAGYTVTFFEQVQQNYWTREKSGYIADVMVLFLSSASIYTSVALRY